MKTNYPAELADVYGSLLSIQHIMDLTLSSMHTCLNYSPSCPEELRIDKHVLFCQLGEVGRCIKMLEEINPEECDPSLF